MGFVHSNGNLEYRTRWSSGSQRVIFENISSTTTGIDEFMVTDSIIGSGGYIDLSVGLYDNVSPPINPTRYATTRFHVQAGKYKYNQVNDFSLSRENWDLYVGGLPPFEDGFELFIEDSSDNKFWNTSVFLYSSSILPPAISTPTLVLTNDVCNNTITLSWNDVISSTPDSINLFYGYEVYRSTNGVDFDLLDTLDSNATSYIDTGRTVNTTYYYYVVAISGTNFSVKTTTTKSTSLSFEAPTLTGSTSLAGIQLNWTDNNGCGTGFQIERRLSPDGAWEEIGGLLSSGTTSYLNDVVEEEIAYDYRIKQFNVLGESEWSDIVTFTIINTAPTLSVAGIDATGITLSWVDNNNYHTHWELEKKTWTGSTWSVIATDTSGITSYYDTDVEYNITYQYRVKLFYTRIIARETDYSNIVEAIQSIDPPVAATLDFVSGLTFNQVYLSWTNNQPATGLTGIVSWHLYRKKLLEGVYEYMGVIVGSGTTTATITESIDDDFEYYVRGLNPTGYADSNSIILPLYPSYTGSTTVTRSEQNELDFSWVNNSDYVTDIEVYYSIDDVTYSLLTTLTSGNTTYNHTGLDEDTTYYYKLRYKNSTNSTSTFTQRVNQLTYLNTPVLLTINQTAPKQLTISWSDNSENETGYQIYRKKGSGEFNAIHVTEPNITTYVDKNLDLNATYSYYVRAIKED